MRHRYMWSSLAISSILATALLLTGLGFLLNDMIVPAASSGKPEQEQEQEASPNPQPGRTTWLADVKEIRIVALGDSLTKGTGDASGKGYVQHVADGLKKRFNKPVFILNNLAVNGMQASELGDRLLENTGYQYAVKQANLILFSIGGNDLFLSARARKAQKDWKAVSVDELTQDMEEAMGRFRRVTDALYTLNPTAKVVYMGLYNPFYSIASLREASLKLQVWNKEAYAALHPYPNMMMVPTFDLFEGRAQHYLSSDHFHPNQEGHERIASRMLESLE